jgi:uncharacterized protein (TIGR03437 family)
MPARIPRALSEKELFMRYVSWLLIGLWCCLAAPVRAQTLPNVRVQWIGQSGFIIQAEGGPAVVSDPPGANFGFIYPATPAEAITISHTHGDHTGTAGIQGTPTLVDGRNVTEMREVMAASTNFKIIPGFHDVNGATRNALITWTQGGIRFMQGGDYGQATLTAEQIAALGQIDVAFIAAVTPTFTAAQVKTFIDQLRPRIAILCHYRVPLGNAGVTLPFRDLTALYANIVYQHNVVMLHKDKIPASGTEIWVMPPTANATPVNSASFAGGAPMAPGSLASFFGTFTNAGTATAQSFPLPKSLGNVEVLVNGVAAPLLYVSPTQINFQVPSRLETPVQVLAEVKVGGGTVGRGQITSLAGGPGLFVAVNLNNQPIAAGTPLRRGEAFVIYATGHGELSAALDDGQPAPANPLITTKDKPRVTIGGVEAEVLFSGLTPGLAGLWQINAVVPAAAPTGANVPLVVTQGQVSNVLMLNIASAAAPEDIGALLFRELWRILRSGASRLACVAF